MVTLNFFVSVLLVLFVVLREDCWVFGSADDPQTTREEKEASEDATRYRLPEYVIPDSYELWILPQLALNNFTYEGRVKIDLRVLNETDSVTLNSVGLNINKERSQVLAILNGTGVNVPIVDQELDTERQFYVISFGNNLTLGNYILELHFVGEVLDDIFGFYRSSYKAAGETRWMGITQFSPIFARRAFPCFDEPYMKATYRLHIGHYGNETATGNTAAEKIEEIKPNYFLTTMYETPRMSTYLVGWSVHDLRYANTSNSSMFGIWTRESMRGHGMLALNEGTKIYEALNKWINVENPVNKMEEIAVPDFYFTAMENWGMITFRESSVLWEEGVTPTKSIHKGLNTISHEYGHTWFGNLVTPKFWNVAWLKEGFATFFGHYGVSLVHEDWKMMDLFGAEVLQAALLEDSFEHNRTMNGKGVGSPKSIRASMDFVAYKKGGSIIRMMNYIIGDWAFHRGLQSYVKTLSNKYATPADLYEHLQSFADQDTLLDKSVKIRDVIESWANQQGYPVVTVTRDYITNSTKISQKKFNLNLKMKTSNLKTGQIVLEDFADPRWWIPLNFASAESGTAEVPKHPTIWMTPRDQSITTPTVEPNDTLLCNIHQAYYYRVNYDTTNWQRLIKHLNSVDFESISSTNRASLIDDAFNLARSGYIHYSIPLDLSRYLVREKDYGPWLAATESFKFLDTMLSGTPDVRRAFKAHVNRLIQPIFKNLTFDENMSDEWGTRLLRNLILSTACSVYNEDCVETANSLFKAWLEGSKKKINPDAKSSVYCTGMRSANQEDWSKVLQRFLETDLHTEQELLIAGLGCTNNSALVTEYLNYSLYDGPEVRKQYRLTIFEAVLNENPENIEHALNFVAENLTNIVATRDAEFLTKVLAAMKKRIVRNEQLQKFTTIVSQNVELLGPSYEDALQATAFVENNIAWISIFVPHIRKWLM